MKLDSKTTTTANISWNVVTIDGGISNYEVYKDGVKIASPTTASYAVTGLTTATTYKFKVKAVGNNGIVSDFSVELSVTTS